MLLLLLLLLLWWWAGASAMLECLAFKATKHRDTLRVMKEVRLQRVTIKQLNNMLCI
jgi:hypothetical protein